MRVLRSPWLRIALVFVAAVGVAFALWWRGPSWHDVADAFGAVSWRWVVAAIGLNLLSVVARSFAWRTVIVQAMSPPRPSYPLVFSAFSVGLLANAVLPGRIGELARVAVLTRRMPPRRGLWATLVGTVFAHRVFDLVPVLLLIIYVLAFAQIPSWAVSSLLGVVGVGITLLAVSIFGARRYERPMLDSLGSVRGLITMARQGLGVMRSATGAAEAVAFQIAGWTCQLFAVWAAMRAFHIYAPMDAAALVLLLMNVATIFPLWPGNVGLLQAAVALPLTRYGVSYARAFAFGIGLQAIEASVGIGFGLLFLAREGLSFATLRRMEEQGEEDLAARAGGTGEPERVAAGSRRG
jgi:uncharacterized membrane protein YbhN (UPF0104 family)